MTEDEARGQDCIGPANCGTVLLEVVDPGSGAPVVPVSRRVCKGSGCGMGWRWDESNGLDKPTRVHPNVLKDYWKGWIVTDAKLDAMGYVEISPPPPKVPTGYCGLAGKP